MQRDRQLHRAEVGGQVAAGLRHRLEHVAAQLLDELRQLLRSRRRSAAGSSMVFSSSYIDGL